MNFQATALIELVGKKSPTKKYQNFIIRLLNCIRDARSKEAVSNHEKIYLLNQIKERDEAIDSLIKKNLILTSWKEEHENSNKRPRLDIKI